MKRKTLLTIIAAASLPFTVPLASKMADVPYTGEGHLMLNADDLEWTDIASMAPPAQMAIIEGNLSEKEAFIFRLRLPAGYEILPHIHPAYERVTVLSGTLHFGHGEELDCEKTHELRQGGVAIMAPGEPMFGYTSEDTIIQLHGTGPWGIEYLNPQDDPRNKRSSPAGN